MPASLLVGLEEIRGRWFWYLLFGAVLLVLGAVAIGNGFAASVVTLTFLGWLIVFSGLAQAILAFWVRQWSGFFMHLLGGILDIVIGVLVVAAPTDAALGLTLLLAVYLLVGGMFRLVAALLLRFPSFAWSVLAGLISFLLGLALWRGWPMSGLFFIGTCVGISLMLHGAAWLVFALDLRKLPRI